MSGSPVPSKLELYVRSFSRLRTDHIPSRWGAATAYRAPHKPLLLLSVLDLFAEGVIRSNLIELTPDLGSTFASYWSLVQPPGKPGLISLPFFHLRSDGFWHLIPRPGLEAILAASRTFHSVAQLRDVILGARLDDDLYHLLHVDNARNVLRATLIDAYFSDEVRGRLLTQGSINQESFQYSQSLLQGEGTRLVAETLATEGAYGEAVRDQGFRRAVVRAYDHRCTLCGVRVLTYDGHTAVAAAHIIPWSVSHDDSLHNGLGLCGTCHWTFDEGLTAISGRFRIVLSPQLFREPNVLGYVAALDGAMIHGPQSEQLWPSAESLQWHRHEVFRSR